LKDFFPLCPEPSQQIAHFPAKSRVFQIQLLQIVIHSKCPLQHLFETVDGRFLQHNCVMSLHPIRKEGNHFRPVQ
jgi:hypothetical protein